MADGEVFHAHARRYLILEDAIDESGQNAEEYDFHGFHGRPPEEYGARPSGGSRLIRAASLVILPSGSRPPLDDDAAPQTDALIVALVGACYRAHLQVGDRRGPDT